MCNRAKTYNSCIGGGVFPKKYCIISEFSPALFGTPCSKFFYSLFCILGHKEHFCFSQKITFWVVFLLLDLGIGDPPSPLLGKLPKKYRFLFWNQILAIMGEYLWMMIKCTNWSDITFWENWQNLFCVVSLLASFSNIFCSGSIFLALF